MSYRAGHCGIFATDEALLYAKTLAQRLRERSEGDLLDQPSSGLVGTSGQGTWQATCRKVGKPI